MPIEPWFPLAVYYADVEDAAAQKESLVSAILKLEKKGHKRRVDSETAWTGDFHGVGRIQEDPRFSWIVGQIEAHTLAYLEELGIDLSKIDLYIQRAWPVVSREDQEVPPHAHHNAHVSAVYYVSVPENGTHKSGAFTIYNDANFNEIIAGIGDEHTNAIKKRNPFNYEEGYYAPTEGRVLIFPSQQRHGVEANETGEMRISLSFDIVITSAEQGDPGLHEFLSPPPSQWKKFGKLNG
ncbi:hypothetical protein Xen7305DRAFT_00048210 [Xenococcus sp. PCC 7305]|uniref:TIGR02466 family protein n=1 Tax=Xenococcus sp. PCC 7305 TaxID=102125 RepID=UPI0002AD1A59|nr:TIGR02466 family protein [Xenococcus sp. PCC 7305]ELS05082.1 hypothetical protein Xen7305DRAFT_00048210 [Xenococcus sp. PCC 7305]